MKRVSWGAVQVEQLSGSELRDRASAEAQAAAATRRAKAPSAGIRLRGLLASKPLAALRAFLVVVGVWWALSLWNANPIQLPTPLVVFDALADIAREGELLENALISTGRLLLSLLVAVALAVPLGFWMGMNRRVMAYVDPLVEILRPISGIAWIPLGLFIFGVGDTLPVFIMTYVAFFPLLLNTIDGVRAVSRRLLQAAETMGVGRAAIVRRVIMPAALPSIVVGFRLAFAGAWTAIVAAELIGAPSGLGFAIEWYRELLMTPKMFAYIITIGFVGYVCDQLLQALQRTMMPWMDKGQS